MAEIISLVHLEVADRAGRLAEVAGLLAQANINLRVACGWVEGHVGHMLLATDDSEAACEVLAGVVSSCHMEEGVAVEILDQVGALAMVAGKCAEADLPIHFVCATCAGQKAMVLLDTADNAKAVQIL